MPISVLANPFVIACSTLITLHLHEHVMACMLSVRTLSCKYTSLYPRPFYKDDTWEKESNIFDKAEILKYWGRNAPERLVKKTSPAATWSNQAENAKTTNKRKRGER